MSESRESAPLVSVIILTKDEEQNLPTALESVKALAAPIFIVDSGSADRTLELARAAGCHIVEHAFTNHAEQLNWAIDHLPISTSWVLRLDADERLTPELVCELPNRLPMAPVDVTAFEIKRRVYFWGHWIRHGGFYPTWLLRVWRRGAARSEQRQMDEHMIVLHGRVARLHNDIIDENRKGLTFWTEKHNRYADRELRAMSEPRTDIATPDGQAGRKRWMKKNIYVRAPRFARALAYWFLRYFVLLGFLDGKPGLVFHFLQGFWYRFLIDAKLEEADRGVYAKDRP